MKKWVKPFVFILLLSVIIEVFVFNFRFFSSFRSDAETVNYEIGTGLERISNSQYSVTDMDNAYVEISNVNKDVKYIFADFKALKKSCDEFVECVCDMQLSVTDEGNSVYSKIGDFSTYSTSDKCKYARIHTYGKVNSIRINFNMNSGTILELNDLIINPVVKFSFSFPRFFFLLFVLLLLYIFRPSSVIYSNGIRSINSDKGIIQAAAVILVIAVNISMLYGLVNLNTAFLSPEEVWQYHTQYQDLAHSIVDGKVNLDIEGIEELGKLSNPYDTYLRGQELGELNGKVWDHAYYNGKIYVYFGIVPELMFYLPYYLITGNDFSTWQGVFLCCAGITIAAFYFMKKFVKRYFPETPFGVYVFLSFLFANGTGIIHMVLQPSFYTLPVAAALMFTLFGLGFWLSAAEEWVKKKDGSKKRVWMFLFIGSLCMALTAGCRPQFLLASFFVFPIFWELLFNEKKLFSKENIIKAVFFTFPYIVVALGIMYYNNIRFHSPFDFGANYNLTSNDMRLRGMNFGRIPDALFAYFLQLPNICLLFPFVEKAPQQYDYFGIKIYEPTYGGVFFTHIFLIFIPFVTKVKKQLKKKNALIFMIMCVVFALIIAVADAQMAGILGRYTSDFTWLLFIAAIMVFLQLYLNTDDKGKRKLIVVMMICGICSLLMDLFIGISQGELLKYSPESFFRLKGWFM